nr:hypothetical protein [uncultured Cohaesibacter sp.]
MITSIARTKAEARLAAIQKSQKEVLNEQEEKALKTRENISRLKALRIAKKRKDLMHAANAKTARKRQTSR